MINCKGHVYNQINMNTQRCEKEKKAKWQSEAQEVIVLSFHILFSSL